MLISIFEILLKESTLSKSLNFPTLLMFSLLICFNNSFAKTVTIFLIVIVKLFHELFQEWFLKQYYASRRSAIQIVTVTFYEVVLYKGFILIKIEHFN